MPAPAITGVFPSGPTATLSLKGKKVASDYELTYVVKAGTASDGPMAILATENLPLVGKTVYTYKDETDPTAICRSKTPKRISSRSGWWWHVVCKYSSDSDSQSQEDEENKEADPVDRPVELEWGEVLEEIALVEDFSDPPKAIVASNGERPESPVTTFIPFPIATLTRWEDTFNASIIVAYVNAVNDDEWLGLQPRQALMESIRAVRILEEGQLLWRVTYQIKISVLPWYHDTKMLDQGSYYIYAGVKHKFLTEERVPYIANLDGFGQEITTGTYNFLDFKNHPEADFGALNLE